MFILISVLLVLFILLSVYQFRLLFRDRARGTIYVHETEEKFTYEQVVDGDPEELVNFARVTFRIVRAED